MDACVVDQFEFSLSRHPSDTAPHPRRVPLAGAAQVDGIKGSQVDGQSSLGDQ